MLVTDKRREQVTCVQPNLRAKPYSITRHL